MHRSLHRLTRQDSRGHSTRPAYLSASSNTGVQTPQSYRVLIDWLAGTLPAHRLGDLVALFEPASWTHLNRGAYGYCRAMKCGDTKVFYNGRPDMGALIEMSGSACREYEAISSSLPWPRFLSLCAEFGFRASRIDVAFDDLQGLLSLDSIRACCDARLYTCRARTVETVISQSTTDREQESVTVYIGSKASDTRIRIYEKHADEDTNEFVRVELEVRRDAAQALFTCIESDGRIRAAVGILAGHLQFRDHGNHADRSRWPITSWWSTFLGDVCKAPLGIAPRCVDVDRNENWLVEQVSPSLALFVERRGGDPLVLQELLIAGNRRLAARRRGQLVGHDRHA